MLLDQIGAATVAIMVFAAIGCLAKGIGNLDDRFGGRFPNWWYESKAFVEHVGFWPSRVLSFAIYFAPILIILYLILFGEKNTAGDFFARWVSGLRQ